MTTHSDDVGFHPAGLVASCVLPGLGHVVRGERIRGAGVFAGVMGLFLLGLFIGGIDSVDRREDRHWFLGQALVGPVAFGVDYIHQSHHKVIDPQTRRPRSAFPDEVRDAATAAPVTITLPAPAQGQSPQRRAFASQGQPVQPERLGLFQTATTTIDGRTITVTRPASKSVARANELGMLCGALAGMLNLIAIIDAGFPTRRKGRAAQPTSTPSAA